MSARVKLAEDLETCTENRGLYCFPSYLATTWILYCVTGLSKDGRTEMKSRQNIIFISNHVR